MFGCSPTTRAGWLRGAALASVVVLSGCGGGSDGGSSQPVVVAPGSPGVSPSPTPTASPPTAEQLEDQRSNAALAANADAAYQAGATGRGVRIAVLDTGLTPGLSEFSGRIDADSADVAGARGLVDGSGHGTAMASIILAARDGKGIHGLAYEATLISFNVSIPEKCVSLTQCPASGDAFIRAVDAAIASKARVINFSANTDQTSEELVAAVRRAAAAGIVIIMSAGNNEVGGQQPLLLSRSFVEAAPGWVVIVGGHDASGGFYAGTNRAGTGLVAASYITALAKDVNFIDRDGRILSDSGSSPATAAVTGAFAMIAQARPYLTGAQIVSLMLANATDAGVPGRDPVFGNGILNLATTFAALPPAR